ncbi:MAG: hypothetical protein RQ751_04095 [Longimicrobiales bacterium]|nr:hypothetical protein [Longimicrobiales bacterium]
MPSIDRPLSGDVMVFDLAAERGTVEDSSTAHRAGRSARTLWDRGNFSPPGRVFRTRCVPPRGAPFS